MEEKMERKPFQLKKEVNVLRDGRVIDRGIIVGRTIEEMPKYDVATKTDILKYLNEDQLDG